MSDSDMNHAPQNTPAPASNRELEFANKWIEDLKKQNSRLGFLWVLFLLIALVSIALAAYQSVALMSESGEWEAKKEVLEQELLETKEFLSQERASLQRVTQERDVMSQELQAFTGETGEQLERTRQLITALKQKISELEDERSLLEDALAENKREYDSLAASEKKQSKILAEKLALLESKDSAYRALVNRQRETKAEMERLSDELTKVSARESDLDGRNANLLKELKQVKSQRDASLAQVKSAEAELQEAQQKVKALTTPIGTSSSIRSPGSSSDNAQSGKTASSPAPVTSEQIIVSPNLAEKEKPKPTPASPLDFDSIAIE